MIKFAATESGKIHGYEGAITLCNYSGQVRSIWLVAQVADEVASVAGPDTLCKRCFPKGAESVERILLARKEG